jgi:hypothetical protein
MRRQQNLLLFIALAVVAAAPAQGHSAPVVGTSSGATSGTSSLPDFSRVWFHPSFPWFEPPAAGAGPITNLSRWPQLRSDAASGTLALPPLPSGVEGVSDYDQLVGDHTNPILQPWAAEVVKKFGEMSRAGITYPNPSNQCWPEPMPFIYKQFQVQIIQQPDKITFLYSEHMDIRRVRLNEHHPAKVTLAWAITRVTHW